MAPSEFSRRIFWGRLTPDSLAEGSRVASGDALLRTPRSKPARTFFEMAQETGNSMEARGFRWFWLITSLLLLKGSLLDIGKFPALETREMHLIHVGIQRLGGS